MPKNPSVDFCNGDIIIVLLKFKHVDQSNRQSANRDDWTIFYNRSVIYG
jgi:hypothetical protein